MEDKKKQAARAALNYLEPNHRIGLGAGTTISHLIQFITALPFSGTLSFVSPSYKTKRLLRDAGLQVLETADVARVDLYFDSCDHYDLELNALKSGGGVHAMEKLIASMADKFLLLVEESKFSEQLTNTATPLCIEILPEAERFVLQQFQSWYPEAKVEIRMAQRKDGAVITEHGNLLVDVWPQTFIALDELNQQLKAIPGVVDHALFYHLVDTALVAGDEGIRVLLPNYEDKRKN